MAMLHLLPQVIHSQRSCVPANCRTHLAHTFMCMCMYLSAAAPRAMRRTHTTLIELIHSIIHTHVEESNIAVLLLAVAPPYFACCIACADCGVRVPCGALLYLLYVVLHLYAIPIVLIKYTAILILLFYYFNNTLRTMTALVSRLS